MGAIELDETVREVLKDFLADPEEPTLWTKGVKSKIDGETLLVVIAKGEVRERLRELIIREWGAAYSEEEL